MQFTWNILVCTIIKEEEKIKRRVSLTGKGSFFLSKTFLALKYPVSQKHIKTLSIKYMVSNLA